MDGFRKPNPEYKLQNIPPAKAAQDTPRHTPQSEPDKMYVSPYPDRGINPQIFGNLLGLTGTPETILPPKTHRNVLVPSCSEFKYVTVWEPSDEGAPP